MRRLDTVTHIVVHHTGSDDHTVDGITSYHVDQRGWEDIGYHYLVGNGENAEDGHVYDGRSTQYQGAHVKGYNENTLAIALIGDCNSHEPTAAQLDALHNELVRLLNEHSLDPEDVVGHRDFPGVSKACPGAEVDLDMIRRRLTRDENLNTV